MPATCSLELCLWFCSEFTVPLGGLRTLVPLGRVHCSQSQPVRQEVSFSTHVPLVVSGDLIRGRSHLGRDVQPRRNQLTDRACGFLLLHSVKGNLLCFISSQGIFLSPLMAILPSHFWACMTQSFPLWLERKQSNFWKSISLTLLTPWKSLSLGNRKLGWLQLSLPHLKRTVRRKSA